MDEADAQLQQDPTTALVQDDVDPDQHPDLDEEKPPEPPPRPTLNKRHTWPPSITSFPDDPEAPPDPEAPSTTPARPDMRREASYDSTYAASTLSSLERCSGTSTVGSGNSSAAERKAGFRASMSRKWTNFITRTSTSSAALRGIISRHHRSSREKGGHDATQAGRRHGFGRTNAPHELSYTHSWEFLNLALDEDWRSVATRKAEHRSRRRSRDGRSSDSMDGGGADAARGRRHVLDLNGRINPESGALRKRRSRTASGKRRLTKEPDMKLYDIREEWNASQLFCDMKAAGIHQSAPRHTRARASSKTTI